MLNNVNGYIDYFRQLAVRHKDLKHDPQTEIGKGKPGDKHFCIFDNNEVIQGLGGKKISTPLLGAELYDNNLSNETVYDIRQSPTGAFMVIDLAKENDFADQERAYALCEGIIYEILQQIWQEHYGPGKDRCTTPFKQFRFNGQITPTGKLFTNYYGYYVQFGFELQNTIDIKTPPAEGTFL